ncbi:hypothetical protein MMC25_006730 [Agyrium rufum]|nr:hypothetical protein [Agyrium rufum]
MESQDDKQWASKYLLDPLNAPGPSEETGPGTHYRSTFAPISSTNVSTASNTHKKQPSVETRERTYPSPPHAANPRRDNINNGQNHNFSNDASARTSSEIPTSSQAGGRTRATSLSSRYIGDESHRPLDIIRKENKAANRAPHLRKQHLVGADTVDKLDAIGGGYHHAGPYDATLLARNTSFTNSPIEAVSGTNEETLKATPREKVLDSIHRHRPLDGVAVIPPGQSDRHGRTLEYQEGTDMMIDGGYKRWPGVQYHPDDLKGKGEPSYTIEKQLKEDKQHRRGLSESAGAIELQSRPRSLSGNAGASGQQSYADWQGDVQRSNTTERKTSGGGIGRRLSKLKKGSKKDE